MNSINTFILKLHLSNQETLWDKKMMAIMKSFSEQLTQYANQWRLIVYGDITSLKQIIEL